MSSSLREVLILGDGASRSFGLPLEREILPALLGHPPESARKGIKPPAAMADARRDLERLLPGLAAASALPTLEEVFALIDQAIADGQALGLADAAGPIDLRALARKLERSAAELLTQPLHDRPPARPEQLAEWVEKHAEGGKGLAVLATGWDCAVESALLPALGPWERAQREVDFGFAWRDPAEGALVQRPYDPRLRLYKLRGSIAWSLCERCGGTYVEFARAAQDLLGRIRDDALCHCGHGPLAGVLATSATGARGARGALAGVWSAAHEALRQAQTWTFVGVGLAARDVALRVLLLAAHRPSIAVRVVDADAGVHQRFRALFPRCQHAEGQFHDFLGGRAKFRAAAPSAPA